MERVRLRAVALASVGFLATLSLVPASEARATTVTAPARGVIKMPTVDAARAAQSAADSSGTLHTFADTGTQGQLKYRGAIRGVGVTTGAPKVYLVFWGSQWGTENPPGSLHFSNDTLGVSTRLVQLFNGLGTNDETWSGVTTQYCEGVAAGSLFCPADAPHVAYPNAPLAGVWVHTNVATPNQASYTDLSSEAVAAAQHFGNNDGASNRNAQYVIVSPHGAHPDGFNNGGGFCAYHSDTNSAVGDVAWTNMPYVPDMNDSCGANFVNAGNAGLLDGVTVVEGHEFSETITDQIPGGGWTDANGEENADKCVWISSGPARIQNLPFASGTFPMQSTWSNDGQTCLIGHAIWGVSGLPDNYVMDLSRHSGYATPGDVLTTDAELTTVTGNPQPVTLSVTGVPPDTTATFSADTTTSDHNSTLTLTTSSTTPFGVYHLTIKSTGAITRTAAYTVTVGDPPATLQNNVAVNNLSATTGSDKVWEIDLPANQGVDFTINSKTYDGDADLYVARDTMPNDDQYDCRDASPGNQGTCEFYNPTAAAHWFVRVHAATAYSDVSLQVSAAFTWTRVLNNRNYREFGDGAGNTQQFMFLYVPKNAKKVRIKVAPRSGDINLYVRIYAIPSPVTADCTSARQGRRSETCTFKFKYPTFYDLAFDIAIYAASDYTGLRVKSQYWLAS
jgi:serine protease